jgi:hypothetical protein
VLDNALIDNLVREAKPRDGAMLRSYVRRGHSADYVRRTMIPSLRRLHPRIWSNIDSKPFNK